LLDRSERSNSKINFIKSVSSYRLIEPSRHRADIKSRQAHVARML
jgi:hypothetical protein